MKSFSRKPWIAAVLLLVATFAFSACGGGGSSGPGIAEAGPSDLTALAVSSTEIDLQWKYDTANTYGLEIERGTDGVTFSRIIVLYNVTIYKDVVPQVGMIYYYRIKTISAQGIASYTNVAPVSAVIGPSDLEARAASNTRIDIEWTDNSALEDGFGIERGTDGVNFSQIDTVLKDVESYSDHGLSAQTTYHYRVVAFTLMGDMSDYSNTASVATVSTPWAFSLGGNSDDAAFSVSGTSDSGFVMAGRTSSFGAGMDDFWVLKLKSGGSVELPYAYGGTGEDQAASVIQAADGGYVVAGTTDSFGAGSTDFWIVKLNADFSIGWEKAYGGPDEDCASSIIQTGDGGYIVAGTTASFGAGLSDIWVLKLDPAGMAVWQKTYGEKYDEYARAVFQTSDGGYIVAGDSNYYGGGFSDFWVLKLDPAGAVEWQKTYGGPDHDHASSISQTSDGGYIMAGTTASFISCSTDFWVLKLDAAGAIEWQKTYGGADQDYARSVFQAGDGGYIAAGTTFSFGAGSSDIWGLKLDPDGTVEWQKSYGGPDGDFARSICRAGSGMLAAAGETSSFSAGCSDFWILKTNPDGTVCFNASSGALELDTNASVGDTSAVSVDTGATVTDTAVTPQDTNATVTQTNYLSRQQAP